MSEDPDPAKNDAVGNNEKKKKLGEEEEIESHWRMPIASQIKGGNYLQ
jgi:hypothetical protein